MPPPIVMPPRTSLMRVSSSLRQIAAGRKLKKTQTNDRSAAVVSGGGGGGGGPRLGGSGGSNRGGAGGAGMPPMGGGGGPALGFPQALAGGLPQLKKAGAGAGGTRGGGGGAPKPWERPPASAKPAAPPPMMEAIADKKPAGTTKAHSVNALDAALPSKAVPPSAGLPAERLAPLRAAMEEAPGSPWTHARSGQIVTEHISNDEVAHGGGGGGLPASVGAESCGTMEAFRRALQQALRAKSVKPEERVAIFDRYNSVPAALVKSAHSTLTTR